MSRIAISDLNEESIFADLSDEQNQQVYGGGLNWGDIGSGALVGAMVGFGAGMPIAGAIVGGVMGALK